MLFGCAYLPPSWCWYWNTELSVLRASLVLHTVVGASPLSLFLPLLLLVMLTLSLYLSSPSPPSSYQSTK